MAGVLAHCTPSPETPERVVVLGGNGFIGQALCRALGASRVPVVSLSRCELDLMAANAAERLCEILTPGDSLVMLSAITRDRDRSWTAVEPNVRMASAVCAAIERVRPRHLVYVSSDAVYGEPHGMISEQTPAAPVDLYGAAHRTRELMIQAASRQAVAILRPTGVYGAGDTHDAYGPNRFLRTARLEGTIRLFGRGEDTRDHIHVADVVALTIRVLQRRSIGVLNLATGRSPTFLEIAQDIAAAETPPARIVFVDRQQPLTHRRFDVSAVFAAFPGFSFRPLAAAASPTVREASHCLEWN